MTPPTCHYCARPSEFLCDFPTGLKGQTRSRPICRTHSVRKGSGIACTRGKNRCCSPFTIDYCPECAGLKPKETTMSVFEQVGRFDESSRPEKAPGSHAKIEVLPIGAYEFQIVSAEARESQQQRTPMLSALLCVLFGPAPAGTEVEHTWFLDEPQKCNYCWADLVALGLPGTGRFSEVLALAESKLKGVRFTGTRDNSKKNNGETFYNLRIGRRVAGTSQPAPVPQPAARPAMPALAAPARNNSSDPIPF